MSTFAQPVTVPAVAVLNHLRVVDITGPDAKEFFQAQVCNDLHALAAGTAQLNGYCHPKGRLLALFTVFEFGSGYRLILPADVLESFVKRLSMFVLRAQVSIEAKPDLRCLGVMCAHNSATLPLQWVKTLPSEPLAWCANDELTCIRWYDSATLPNQGEHGAIASGAINRFLVIAPIAQSEHILASNEIESCSDLVWRWADIVAGIPSVSVENVEQFIPQMMNLQFLDGLSFKKGCYPGQEIVARMQYLGKLKRHMRAFRWTASSDAAWRAQVGGALSCADDDAAGRIVDAIADQTGGVLLAVVKVDAQGLEHEGQILEPLELPYSIVVKE